MEWSVQNTKATLATRPKEVFRTDLRIDSKRASFLRDSRGDARSCPPDGGDGPRALRIVDWTGSPQLKTGPWVGFGAGRAVPLFDEGVTGSDADLWTPPRFASHADAKDGLSVQRQ